MSASASIAPPAGSPDNSQAFRQALASFPSGVTIVTTRDPGGQPCGFTASAFSSVSLEPPMVLVCLGGGARCRPSFSAAGRFVISILRPEHEAMARRFASKGTDKFAAGGFCPVGTEGHLAVEDALATFECRMEQVIPAGDHYILLGAVDAVHSDTGVPMLHLQREFWNLENAAALSRGSACRVA